MNTRHRAFALLLAIAIFVHVLTPIYSARAAWWSTLFTDASTAATAGTTGVTAGTTGATATASWSLNLKAYVLDPLAYIAAQTVLRAMTNQILGWIQGTDSGFMANLEQGFRREADLAGGAFLNKLAGIDLCTTNLSSFLQISLRTPGIRQQLGCTLSDIGAKAENFFQDFQQGGWPAFIKIGLEPQNNPYGAYLIALDAKVAAEDAAGRALGAKFQTGKGFLGFNVPKEKNCRPIEQSTADILAEGGKTTKKDGQDVVLLSAKQELIQVAGNPTLCDLEDDIKTPGSLFSDALPTSVFSDVHRTELAHQFNEGLAQIVFALLKKAIQASTAGGQGVMGTPDLAQLPPVNPAEAGFGGMSFLTNQTDDTALQLQIQQEALDGKIQDLEGRIAAINDQVVTLEATCAAVVPPAVCDRKLIDKLKADQASIEQERTADLDLLKQTDENLRQILELRAQALNTFDPTVIQNLNNRLLQLTIDAQTRIYQARHAELLANAGDQVNQSSANDATRPPSVTTLLGSNTSQASITSLFQGQQTGTDANDNFVKMITNARDRQAKIIAYLNTRITTLDQQIATAGTQANKDAFTQTRDALTTARDGLKKLGDDLDTLRANFMTLTASAAQGNPESNIPAVMNQITGKITEINDRILSIYTSGQYLAEGSAYDGVFSVDAALAALSQSIATTQQNLFAARQQPQRDTSALEAELAARLTQQRVIIAIGIELQAIQQTFVFAVNTQDIADATKRLGPALSRLNQATSHIPNMPPPVVATGDAKKDTRTELANAERNVRDEVALYSAMLAEIDRLIADPTTPADKKQLLSDQSGKRTEVAAEITRLNEQLVALTNLESRLAAATTDDDIRFARQDIINRILVSDRELATANPTMAAIIPILKP